MAPLPEHPVIPKTITDPVLGEAVRRLKMVTTYIDTARLQGARVDAQFAADVESMATRGKWAPPAR